MLLAAVLAPLPLYAQEAAPAAPAAVVAPAQAQLPEELAPLAPLAIAPADADWALIVTNLGKRLGGFLPVQDEAEGLGGIAIVSSKGNAGTAKGLIGIVGGMRVIQARKASTESWCGSAKEQLREVIADTFKSASTEAAEGAARELAGLKLHPVYGIMNLTSDKALFEEMVIDSVKEACQEVAEEEENVEFVTIGGFSGVKGVFPAEEAGEAESELEALIKTELAKRTFYILFGMVGDNAVVIVCEDPSEIALAATPEESLLHSKTWEQVMPNLKDDVIFACSASAEICSAGVAQMTCGLEAMGTVAGTFAKMAEADPACADKYKAAEAGVQTIVSQLKGMLDSSTAQKPAFCQVWGTPGAYHAELTGDACGVTFAPAKRTLEAKAADADTIFCCESTPIDLGTRFQRPDCKALASASVDIYHGVVASLTPEYQNLINASMQQSAAFLPEFSAVCTALGSLREGLDGHIGLVVDGKAEAPAYLTGGEKCAMPRVAFVSGVKNRAKLAEAWDGLLHAAGGFMEKCGQDSSMLDMLPIIPSKVGDAMSYTVAFPPFTTPDLSASVSVSDTLFVAGTSGNLNKEIATATGTAEFEGITFTLNTQPLATTARSIADAMLKAAGPIEKQRFYFNDDEDDEEVEGEEEEGVNAPAKELVEGEDYVEFDVPTEAQRPALQAKEIADDLEELAKHVKEVSGSITIKDDVETIHVDVILTGEGK